MADTLRGGVAERDIEQAITALKKGSHLLKYGRRGKPKFCPFQLSNDESAVLWYSGKKEKQLKLNQVSRIIPGQRTAIFQRYPRPEKEYQSFSLLYNDRSLDLICKDKDEAEVWFVGLKTLITRGNYPKWRIETRSDSASSESPHSRARKTWPSITQFDPVDAQGTQTTSESIPPNRLGKAFSDLITYTEAAKNTSQPESVTTSVSSLPPLCVDYSNGRISAAETVRVSLSSAVSSSSQGSYHEDFDSLGDVFVWGEGVGDGMLGGGVHRIGNTFSCKMDALLPKALESSVVLDVRNIACGGRHAVLVTRQGEIFSWGEESGGRLGHGVDADSPYPKLINTLSGMNIELVACGEYHTAAVTISGALYTWGDGTHNSGLLGHGTEVSHWIPKRVSGDMEGLHVSYISCGPWHTAAVTSSGQLFTFGDGSFGALGHGDLSSTNIPREVEISGGLRTTRVACGVWHTAAVVEVMNEISTSAPSSCSSSLKLFTWGDGDKGQLGHGDKEARLIPVCVSALVNQSISQVACGQNLTAAITTSGQVYTMGSTAYGQLGNPVAKGKAPARVEGKIVDSFVEQIACGSHHVAVLTSKAEVYTWGRGANGQLGHGDNEDRNTPALVDFMKDRQVKGVACGSNFTAVISLHKWVPSADHSSCSGCRLPFGFKRKRHNCYNCGLVFCKACSSRKSLKAALAPNMSKPYRVCDECSNKLKKSLESSSVSQIPRISTGNMLKSTDVTDIEALGPRLQSQVSRLSSILTIKQGERRHSKHDLRFQSSDNHVFTAPDGNPQLGGFSSFKVSTSLFGAPKKVLPSSGSTMSPVSGKSSPPRTSEVMLFNSDHMNDSLSQEIGRLRTQVEDLTSRSQHLEAELERTSRKLEEVTEIAANEAEKCKSAKEVIKSLTAQLKEMAAKLPEEHGPSCISVPAGHTSSDQNVFPSGHFLTNVVSCPSESNGNVNKMLTYGTKVKPEKAEWVVKTEPGVYLTLSSLPDGSNELKRVRFSRKHFTEQQAEKWWAENGTKVCERHNILSYE